MINKTTLWQLMVMVCGLQFGSAFEEGYFRFGVGPNWAEDLEGKVGGVRLSYELKPGGRFDIAPGIALHKVVALEFNTGVLWNEVSSLQAPAPIGKARVSGDLYQVPFLLNIVARPDWERIRPLFGGGFGGAWQHIAIDRIGGSDVEGSDNYFAAAVQAIAGVTFQVNELLSIGAAYNYFRTIVREDTLVIGVEPEKLEDHGNHAVSLILQLEF